MTGSVVTRKPQFILLTSEQEAYDLIDDDNANFDPEDDIADEQTARHVYDALQRMQSEASVGAGTYREAYEYEWIRQTMSSLSTRWGI